MALITLVSAHGAPGVTTTSLALALAWPRPSMLVEADPSGAGALQAGYFRGAPMPGAGTLLDLVMAQQANALAQELPTVTGRIPNSTVDLLRGILTHSQSRVLTPLWEPLAEVLRDLERNGQDVLVDGGRLGTQNSPTALMHRADLTLVVTRSTLPALVAAQPWLETLRDDLDPAGTNANLGLLLVGPGQPYSAREVARVLQVPVVASLAWDPVSAEVFSLGNQPSQRRFESAPLPKSLRAAAPAITTVIARNRAALEPTAPTAPTAPPETGAA